MSLRLEMLQAARLAPKVLADSTALVADFLHSQQNPDGGFKDRSGRSDLYYTVFGLDGSLALQADLPRDTVAEYLSASGDGEGLDFVHLCCLARCWAALAVTGCRCPSVAASGILSRIERHRSRDGGYHAVENSPHGTCYASFLGLGAYQDLSSCAPQPQRIGESLEMLRTSDGAWANDPGLKTGATNATAAALALLRQLGASVPPGTADWLLARRHPQGGFTASPQSPMPDLLSTATTLHALAGLQVPFDDFREPCLDFIDTLWTNAGGFHGHWADEDLDCEYTFYGLLALGHLSI